MKKSHKRTYQSLFTLVFNSVCRLFFLIFYKFNFIRWNNNNLNNVVKHRYKQSDNDRRQSLKETHTHTRHMNLLSSYGFYKCV